MPSDYTPSLRLVLPVTGELDGTWGDVVNEGITELVDNAIAGRVAVAHNDSANYFLTVNDGITDESRYMVLNITGTLTAARNVVCPAVSKLFVVENNTTGGFDITFKTNSGTGVTIPAGQRAFVLCDGTNVISATGVVGSPQVISVNSSTAALRVTQTGSGDVVRFEDVANPDATPFVIDADGRVINGHTTSLDLGIGRATSYQQNAATILSASQALGLWAASTAGVETIYAKSRGAVGVYTASLNGDDIARIRHVASDGNAMVEAVRITSTVDATPGAGSMPGRLTFSTTPTGSSTPVERMRIDSAGRVGIGGTPLTGTSFELGRNHAISTDARGFSLTSTVQPEVTSSAIGYRSSIGTADASFTIGSISHFFALQGSIGAGSTVTNQFGFNVASGLTGATNNYGFYSNIASGAGRWNFYANGTAANYFAGIVLQGDATERTLSGSIVASVQIAGTSIGGASAAGVFAGNSVNAPAYVFAKSRGTLASPTAVASGDGLGSLRFDGHTGAAFELAALISAAADGAFSAGTVPARIAIATSGASGTPVERLRIDSSGSAFQEQIAPAAVNATATLTVANLRTRIITSTTAAAVTGTLPTGTLMEGLYNGRTDMGYDWSVINTGGTNNFTVAAGTAHTVVGNMVVAPNTSGAFRSRRTATNTWITYRVA
jgi:hypothetical protein